jgi:D-cysteine desulfhydrase
MNPFPSLLTLPTPLHRLEGPSRRLGVEVWIKRDDMTGFAGSGNKIRKLVHLMLAAREAGATTVLTTGGLQSNHCRATAVAARHLGMRPLLLLRGRPPLERRGDQVVERREPGADGPLAMGFDGNLLLDAILGAEVRFVDAAGYRDRDRHLEAIAAELRGKGERPYIIPEGGSNALGSQGYQLAARELAGQARDQGVVFDSQVCAVGSGGTLAGLAMHPAGDRLLGVAVCDDRATFRAKVEAIAAEAKQRTREHWDVVEGFQGRGYGLSTPAELTVQARFARETGILLDPVYTGKAWCALEALAETDRARLGRRVLFWHTGGGFGLFGRGPELALGLRGTLEHMGYVGAEE